MIHFLLALAAAQPSALAGEASCVTDRFSPAERTAFVAMAQQNDEPSPQLRQRFEEVGRACVESRGWDAGEAEAYFGFAVATMIRDESGEQLRRAGVDPGRVAGWLARQEERVRVNPAIAQGDAERLIMDLARDGVPMEALEAHGSLIGAYVAGLAMVERLERGMALE